MTTADSGRANTLLWCRMQHQSFSENHSPSLLTRQSSTRHQFPIFRGYNKQNSFRTVDEDRMRTTEHGGTRSSLEMSGYSFGCVLAHQMAYQLLQAFCRKAQDDPLAVTVVKCSEYNRSSEIADHIRSPIHFDPLRSTSNFGQFHRWLPDGLNWRQDGRDVLLVVIDLEALCQCSRTSKS